MFHIHKYKWEKPVLGEVLTEANNYKSGYETLTQRAICEKCGKAKIRIIMA